MTAATETSPLCVKTQVLKTEQKVLTLASMALHLASGELSGLLSHRSFLVCSVSAPSSSLAVSQIGQAHSSCGGQGLCTWDALRDLPPVPALTSLTYTSLMSLRPSLMIANPAIPRLMTLLYFSS